MTEIYCGRTKHLATLGHEGATVIIDNGQSCDFHDWLWLEQMATEEAAEDRSGETFPGYE